MTMIGVAVGLGAVWRFPYMVGRYGGAAFVLFYLGVVLIVGIPSLMAEWILGLTTQRGPLGAFERGRLPGGKYIGGFLFSIVFFATGYYSNALGWVGFHALAELTNAFGINIQPDRILPPVSGFKLTSILLQLLMTAVVVFLCSMVMIKGLRRGIEKTSKWIVPMLFIILAVLIIRSNSLQGSFAGVKWYIGGFHFKALTPEVMAAALGMAFFSMSLGGTFMVIYGSYMKTNSNIGKNAIYSGIGAVIAGLLAGFAIFPAVFAFKLIPNSGPGLIFETLPLTFNKMPAGWIFGLLFFLGLFGAAFLSDVAAFEVLVGGIVDNTRIVRKRAVFLVAIIVFFLAIPPMINYKIFIPWDLTFGSGMQALGSLFAVITAAWFIKRATALKALESKENKRIVLFLYWWMRLVIPFVILFIGITWFIESL
jgi:NSS family neurotransmitter:Na+ symporter